MSTSDKYIDTTAERPENLEILFHKVSDKASHQQQTPDSQDDDEHWEDAEAQLSYHDGDDEFGHCSISSSYIEAVKSKSRQIDDDFDDLILHKAIFHNDNRLILSILKDSELLQRKDLVNKKDKHGNTALHLACMLGRSKEIINAFFENSDVKWSVDIKNANRWTPFHEACSYGNRDAIFILAKQIKDDFEDSLHNKKLTNFLERTKNYRLVLEWEFQSWVPFISRWLPSDVCVINKQGKYLRIDTRLLDLGGLFRKTGRSCLVYSNDRWIVMDDEKKRYEYWRPPKTPMFKDIEEKVDEFMSFDIIDAELKSSGMQLTRSTSGWIWKANKNGRVGRFSVAMYDLTDVYLITRKRREHLSEEDLKRNKSAYKFAVHAFKFGEKPSMSSFHPAKRETAPTANSNNNVNPTFDIVSSNDVQADNQDDNDDEESIVHRDSLPPPPPTNVTWDQYIQAKPGQHPCLGREQKLKVNKTAVKASVAMSKDFPLSKNEFLELLSVVPIKMFKKLQEFVEMKLPDGFPVRFEIPVFPALTARITFEDFTFLGESIDESLFSVPQDYERDPNLIHKCFRQAEQSNENEDDNTRERCLGNDLY